MASETNLIPTSALTPVQVKAAILTFLEQQPEDRRWIDLFTQGGVGTTVFDTLGAFGAFLSHRARAVRRESNLYTARLNSSIAAIAYTLGYPLARRKAARIILTFHDDLIGSSITSTSSLLGTIGTNLPVSTRDGENLNHTVSADSKTIECVIGTWHTVSELTIPDEEFAEVEFVPVNADGEEINLSAVDNDLIQVFLQEQSETEVSLKVGSFVEDLRLSGGTLFGDVGGDREAIVFALPTQIVVTFGAVISEPDIIFGKRPAEGSTAKVRYLINPTTIADSEADYSFSLFSPSTIFNGLDRLTLENFVNPATTTGTTPLLKTRAFPADNAAKAARIIPGYFSAKRRMVNRPDHENIVLSKNEIHDCKIVAQECSVTPSRLGTELDCESSEAAHFDIIPQQKGTVIYSQTFIFETAKEEFTLDRAPSSGSISIEAFGNSTELSATAGANAAAVNAAGKWFVDGATLTIQLAIGNSIKVTYNALEISIELPRESSLSSFDPNASKNIPTDLVVSGAMSYFQRALYNDGDDITALESLSEGQLRIGFSSSMDNAIDSTAYNGEDAGPELTDDFKEKTAIGIRSEGGIFMWRIDSDNTDPYNMIPLGTTAEAQSWYARTEPGQGIVDIVVLDVATRLGVDTVDFTDSGTNTDNIANRWIPLGTVYNESDRDLTAIVASGEKPSDLLGSIGQILTSEDGTRSWIKMNDIFERAPDNDGVSHTESGIEINGVTQNNGVRWRALGVKAQLNIDYDNSMTMRPAAEAADVEVPDIISITRRPSGIVMQKIDGFPARKNEYGSRIVETQAADTDTNTPRITKAYAMFHDSLSGEEVDIQYIARPGTWGTARTRLSSNSKFILKGCQLLFSYIAADSDSEYSAPTDDALTSEELEALELSLEPQQMLGEELFFRNAVAVSLNVDMRIILQTGIVLDMIKPLIDELIEDQCWILGGSFSPPLLVRRVNALDGVLGCDISRPRATQKTSKLGYFMPPVDGADLTEVQELKGFTE